MDWTRDDIVRIVNETADRHGLNRTEFLAGAIAESNLDPYATRRQEWPDWSVGLFQQTPRFAEEGDQSDSECNWALIRQLYSDPTHASNVAAIKFGSYRVNERNALDAWCRYNWPTREPMENPNRGNYDQGLQRAQLMGGPLAYRSRVTPCYQRYDWDCSAAATTTALWSLGAWDNADDLRAALVASGTVTPRNGLEWGNGSGLVAYLQSRLPDARVDAIQGASYDDAADLAGRFPILAGGHAWGNSGHWVMVKHVTPDGLRLYLANPAARGRDGLAGSGGPVGIFGGDMIDADGWGRLGDWTLVTVRV